MMTHKVGKHPLSMPPVTELESWPVDEMVTKRRGDKLGKNMDWFLDQVLQGTDICDYELTRVYWCVRICEQF